MLFVIFPDKPTQSSFLRPIIHFALAFSDSAVQVYMIVEIMHGLIINTRTVLIFRT